MAANFLRNPEARLPLILQGAVFLLSLILAIWRRPSFVPFVLILGLLYSGIMLLTFVLRYRRIRQLSDEVDRILHSGANLKISSYEEGELSILAAEIEKMVAKLSDQSEQLQKDKVYLSDSLADISHQLRTPLTSIHLLLNKLERGPVSRAEHMQIIAELYTLLDRIDWLVNVLLKISKIDAGTISFSRAKVPLELVVKQGLEPIAIRLDLKNITVRTDCKGFFTGDLAWTAEAVGNITKNCLEYTPEGGTLEITACENPLYSEIVIKDTGPGIPETDLPRIFERFYKGKNSSGASVGIGLALARMVVTAQNGSVKAENRPNGGAKFTLRFYKSVI